GGVLINCDQRAASTCPGDGCAADPPAASRAGADFPSRPLNAFSHTTQRSRLSVGAPQLPHRVPPVADCASPGTTPPRKRNDQATSLASGLPGQNRSFLFTV